MDGVTILSVIEPTSAVEIFLVMLFVGASMGFLIGVMAAISELEPYYCVLGLIIGIFLGSFFGVILSSVQDKPSQYKVTVSEEVNFQEFHNTYDIVSQEGDIYTVKLK